MRTLMSIKDIVSATGGTLLEGAAAARVTGVSTDTRNIRKGEAFLCLRGKNFDGHAFVKDALDRGAAAVIHSSRVDSEGRHASFIKVADTYKALGSIAAFERKRFKGPVICVTGSNGKTTVKEMISHILSDKCGVLATRGTENNIVGVSHALLRLGKEHDFAVLELGSNHKGEIRELSAIARPDIAAVTNIGPSHMKFLKTKDEIAAEKLSILDFARGGTAVLNGDDRSLVRNADRRRFVTARKLFFGMGENCDFRATRVSFRDAAGEFVLNDACRVRLKVWGIHNIYNALCAIAACCAAGVPLEKCSGRIGSFRGVELRMEPGKLDSMTIVSDCYNANLSSFSAMIETLQKVRGKGRRIVVFGGMLELGAASGLLHHAAGGLAARSGVDYFLTYGKLAGTASRAAAAAGMPQSKTRNFGRAEDLVKHLLRLCRSGDTVVFKASRGVKMEEIRDCFITSFTR